MRKILIGLITSMLMIVTWAANGPSIQEGVDYTMLATPVQATSEPKGRVNVKEFFSFTCIHCKAVDPLVEQFIVPNKKIDLNKIQVVWGDNAAIVNFAKLNASIQLLGLTKLYTPAFNAIFSQQNLNDPTILKQFLAQNGLSQEQITQFMNTYNSFTVNAKVAEYKDLTTNYNITATPTFIVADKYVVKPAQPARLIEVVQALVNKVN